MHRHVTLERIKHARSSSSLYKAINTRYQKFSCETACALSGRLQVQASSLGSRRFICVSVLHLGDRVLDIANDCEPRI